MDILLGIAAALAALVLLLRTLRRRHSLRRTPGTSRYNPLPVSNFGEIDAAVLGQECTCHGRFRLRGEGPIASDDAIRRVTLECRECGRERHLYFDLACIGNASGHEDNDA